MNRRPDAATALFGVALLASAALLIGFGWNLTFFQDTWAFLLERQGSSVGDFLRPHNEHLVVLSVAVTKLCVAVFGMTSARPEMLLMTLTLLVTGALLYIYVRRRLGSWVALFATLPVLFLGSSWMILLWPFENEFSGAVMAGLGMLLLLERGDRKSDAWACLLLTVSIGFGSLGLSFAAAALVDVFLQRRRRGWSRIYVVVIPVGLYLLWYLGWGHTAPNNLTLSNVLASPTYMLDGVATALASLVGLNTATGADAAEPVWGRPLLLALIGGLLLLKWRRPGISPRFWPVAAAMTSYWLLAGFNFFPGREPASNRYVYAGVIFLVMCLADLLQGERLSRRGMLAVASVAVLALGPNLVQMKEGKDILEGQSVLTRANLAALEIARRTVPPDFALTPENAGTLSNVAIVPGWYFEASDAYGSPAFSPAQLRRAEPVYRHWADVLLSDALPLTLVNRRDDAGMRFGSNCTAIPAGGGPASPEVELDPGLTQIRLAPGPEVQLKARRFATGEHPVSLGSVPGGSLATLRVPRDYAAQPWYLHLEPKQRALVCG